MYYRNWIKTAVKFLMHLGRFVGFSWHVGDPMTFKVLQCHKDPHNWSLIMHKGVIVPHSLTATGYNSALQPKSDTYFQNMQVEGSATSKTLP